MPFFDFTVCGKSKYLWVLSYSPVAYFFLNRSMSIAGVAPIVTDPFNSCGNLEWFSQPATFTPLVK